MVDFIARMLRFPVNGPITRTVLLQEMSSKKASSSAGSREDFCLDALLISSPLDRSKGFALSQSAHASQDPACKSKRAS